MGELNIFRTDFLFSTPTILSGAGTVINLAGDFYNFNTSKSPQEADCLAIKNDFGVIGQDIKKAVSEFEKQVK